MRDRTRHRPENPSGDARPPSAPPASCRPTPSNLVDLRAAQQARRRLPCAPGARPALAAPPPPPPPAPAADLAGGGAPFWDIWLEHREHLHRQSLRLMAGNLADAEDAMSTAMLKASQKFALYADDIINQRAWLTRLLHNACMDLYRAQKRQARWSGEGQGEPAAPAAAAGQESQGTPEEIAHDRERLALVAARIEQLPPSLRLPFVMRFIQNQTYAQIAAHLELSNCAVRKRVQLARERLKRNLDP